jgi:hypothetical protein
VGANICSKNQWESPGAVNHCIGGARKCRNSMKVSIKVKQCDCWMLGRVEEQFCLESRPVGR